MVTENELVVKSLKEVFITGVFTVGGLILSFPLLWILSLTDCPKYVCYLIIAIAGIGPFMEVERRRKNENYQLQKEENERIKYEEQKEKERWEHFIKMKRPGWPWNKDEPLSDEDILKYS